MDFEPFADSFDRRVDDALFWVQDNAAFLFDGLRTLFSTTYDSVLGLLTLGPWYAVIVVIAIVGSFVVGIRYGIFAALGLVACWAMGLWPDTMSTFALVLSATFYALLLALPLGVLAGLTPLLDNVVEPTFDLIQTMPPYIYLLPAIALLGYGPATALAATIVVAMAPAVRLTSLGIRQTPGEFLELSQATGMTGLQKFFKIRLPFAVPSIMAGINQSLMLAFGLVVIAGIVGSGGLGQTIYSAIRTLDIAESINAAIAIVILTMIIDRFTQNLAGSGNERQ